MKLLDYTAAPNPRRVRVFLAEKGVEVPNQQIDIAKSENREPAYLAKNPMGGVPALELDDGTVIAESVAICRYFEELHPEPTLMGVDAADKALVEMWNRREELYLLGNVAGCFRNTHDFFKGRIPQVPEYGKVCKEAAEKHLEFLDGVLTNSEFIAGDRYTIADITAQIAIDFGRVAGIRIAEDQKNLTRWHEAVSSRPSAKA